MQCSGVQVEIVWSVIPELSHTSEVHKSARTLV